MAQYVADRLTRGQSGAGAFPIADFNDLKVPDVIVTDLTARNAIEEWRRTPYMVAYVIADDTEYRLGSNTTIAGQVWTEIVYSDPNALVESDVFDVDGFIKPDLIKNLFINDSFVVADSTAMLGLQTVTGNAVILTSTGQVFIKLNNDDPSDLSDFAEITGNTGAVTSVNGFTGAVNITIANLLAVPANQTSFDNAVAANSLVLSHSASISSLTTNKADLVSGTVPLSQLPYVFQSGLTPTGAQVRLGGSLLADTTITQGAYNMTFDASDVGNFRVNFGSDANQDLIIRQSSGYWGRLGLGSEGQILKISGGNLTWSNDLGGTTGATVNWGAILGTLSSQTDLNNALNDKASITGSYANPSWITSIAASKITGTISIANLPATAIERIYTYAGVQTLPQNAGLTTTEVQNGDIVKMTSTGLMYVVKDDTQLNSSNGYEEFTAGTAAAVPWTGLTGTPTAWMRTGTSLLTGNTNIDIDTHVLTIGDLTNGGIITFASGDIALSTDVSEFQMFGSVGGEVIRLNDSRTVKKGIEYDATTSTGADFTQYSLINQSFADGKYWKLTGTSTITGNVTIAQAGFNTTFTGTGKVTFSPSATVSGLNIGTLSGVPATLVDGDVYYNATQGGPVIRAEGLSQYFTHSAGAQAVINRIPYFFSSNNGRLNTSANLTFDGTGLLVGGGTITASTRVDVRGISSGNIQRWADDANTQRLLLTNTGLLTLTSATAGGNQLLINNSAISGQIILALQSTSLGRLVFNQTGEVLSAFGNNPGTGITFGNNTTLGALSGTQSQISTNTTFSPASGTAAFNSFLLQNTINQQGGANGQITILNNNPTITSAVNVTGYDWNPSITSLTGTHLAFRSTSGQILFGNSSGDVVTANTRLDIRGVSVIATDLATRWANSSNTQVGYMSNGGNFYALNASGISAVPSADTWLRVGTTTLTTSGTFFGINYVGSFVPTSGTANLETIATTHIVNQTGGANGTVWNISLRPNYTSATNVYGIDYNPTITSVTGTNLAWRNTSGQVLINGSTVTANTSLDVRGISGGNALRVANSTNSPLFIVPNSGSPTLTTNNFIIDNASGGQYFDLVANLVNDNQIRFRAGSNDNWILGKAGGTKNFMLLRYNDAGIAQGSAWTVDYTDGTSYFNKVGINFSGSITTNTALDVRGISGGTVQRWASDTNTERGVFKNDGVFRIGTTDITGAGTTSQIYGSTNGTVGEALQNASNGASASVGTYWYNDLGGFGYIARNSSANSGLGGANSINFNTSAGFNLTLGVSGSIGYQIAPGRLHSFTSGANNFNNTSFTFTQGANTAGNVLGLSFVGGAHTGLTASTESSDVNFNLARTVQFNTTPPSTQRAFRILAPTYSTSGGAGTMTKGVTLSISGAPTATGGMGLTESYALDIESGALRLGAITQDDALTQVLVRDGTTGQLKYRASSTLGGGGISGLTTNRIPYATSSTTLGDNANLIWDNTNGFVGIGALTADRRLHVELDNATTNAVDYVARFTKTTSGTPANGIGVGIEFEVETASANNEIAAAVQTVLVANGSGTEYSDILFKTLTNGSAQDVLRLSRFDVEGLTLYNAARTFKTTFDSGVQLTVTKSSATGSSDSYYLRGGNGIASDVNGMHIILAPGDGFTNGNGGDIYLYPGLNNGTGVGGNIALQVESGVNWQGMRRGAYISNALAEPTGNPSNGVFLWAFDVSSSSELKVRDEAGNTTTLSPHNFSLIPDGPSEELAWAYYSEKAGKKINVDMLKLARWVEKLTGDKLVYTK